MAQHIRGDNSYAPEAAVIKAAGGPGRPRLLDEVRGRLRLGHYSLRTERVYVAWIRRFILANGKAASTRNALALGVTGLLGSLPLKKTDQSPIWRLYK